MMGIQATDWLFTYGSLSYSSRRTTTVWQQSHSQDNVYVNNESCSLFFQNHFKSQIYIEIVRVDNFVFIVWLHALQRVTFHSCPFIRISRCESWVIHSMLSVYLGLLHAKTSFYELVPTLIIRNMYGENVDKNKCFLCSFVSHGLKQ